MRQMLEFHTVFGVAIGSYPGDFNSETAKLRISLLTEELQELETAINENNLVKILDALTDLQYVLDGTYLSLGFANFKHVAYDEVHASNMSKIEDGKPLLRDDGKVLKGRNYFPPDLMRILFGDKEKECSKDRT